MLTTWWRRLTARPDAGGTDPHRARERARAIRERLDVLDLQRLELLADEGVPGRKHRLDAVAGASADLRAELDRLEPAVPVSPPTRCPTAPGSR